MSVLPKMNDTLVIFSHGKESGPWGSKIASLAKIAMKYEAEVASIDYSNMVSVADRVEKLIAYEKPNFDKLMLVGSSMGGYVATVASEYLSPDALFLMAPAFYLDGYPNQNPFPYSKKTLIVHGRMDTVVPIENSQRFAASHNATLVELDGDHSLHGVLSEVEGLFERFWINTMLS